ncbi:hypothetical protein WI36_03260 [Burkholderia ubonensis]|uniref:hypothetical protein n=1 Tax=Burkholderia ubonensis TaxID=101571 RepID=UPI00075CCCA8|nr:hypothetical protein [Burkholderia ubonensis]KUZ66130.1 hypothetical protein WI37_34830 [Burkholderia ubonensis]KUZ82513.1 hypothetical protein WI36_03260 [Burkholderia ubonensis]KVA02108.1 hypothetical protein WI40_05885 [Burkholderia ubonensis]
MVRLIGCGLLALACATPGMAADHYVEVWNPPEARTAAPRPPAAHTPDAHAAAAAPAKHAAAQQKAVAKAHKRHVAPATQTLKTGAHRMPAPATPTAPAARPVAQPAPGRLTVMQPDAQDSPHGLAFTDIPRQYTPDGNVLRVGTRNGPAKVTR